MITKTILQIPIDKSLRDQASIASQNLGFSSLQETIRVFLKQLSTQQVNLTITPTVQLSKKAIKRYQPIITDIKTGKNIVKTSNVDDFMQKLSK